MNPNRNKNVKHNEVGKSATAGRKNLGRDQCAVYSSTIQCSVHCNVVCRLQLNAVCCAIAGWS